MEKLMIIDGHSILNRAYYALPILTNDKGQHTNAVYGFLNMMFKMIEDESPNYIGVSFDLPRPTFRHLKYKDYKGNRKKAEPEFKEQVPYIKEVLSSMNITIYEKEGYEADDILATIAKQAESLGIYPIIVSGDRDLLQIATDKIKIKIPKTSNKKTQIYDYFAKDVLEEYGVTPTQFIDVKALMGDGSDNVPGVPTIGEKTAIKIIQKYNTVENAIQNLEDITPKRAKENLGENIDQAMLSKYLVTIDTNVPVEFEQKKLEMKDLLSDGFLEMIRKYDLKTFLKRFGAENKVITAPTKKQDETITYNLINTKYDASNFFKAIKKDETIAYSMIYDEDIFIGISFFMDNVATFIMHTKDFTEDDLLTTFKPFLGKNYKKVTIDLKTDIVYLSSKGIKIENVVFDIMIAGYVLDPTKNKYEYNDISARILNEIYTSKEELLGKEKLKSKKFLLDIEQEEWLKYVCNQSVVCHKAMPLMERKIAENEQKNLFYNIEMPLINVLASMEIYGIEVCLDELLEYQSMLEEELTHLTKEIYFLSNEEFNINSPKQLGEILFEKLNLEGGKKTATGWSTAVDILEKFKGKHEIIDKVLIYRTYAKLKSTYADGLINVLDKKTSRIYSKFNQTVTATGRISSTEPNLQNIPIRLPLGHRIRKVFKAQKDYVFIDADYSQIELRVLAHLSKDDELIKAFNNGEDIHSITASKILKKDIKEITSSDRTMAKAINFGLIYGKQAFTLAKDLGISKNQAEAYIDEYFNKYKEIKKFLDRAINYAEEYGYSKTYFNRIRNIKEINSSNFNQKNAGKRIAMNTPIQGTAADIIKIAMVKVYNRIQKEKLKSRLILQVHDELLIETHKSEIDTIKTILKEEMEGAVDFLVKLSIDMHEGENWYDAK